MGKEDTPIFSEATPGDIIRSEEWNLIQRELRYALRHHKHTITGEINDADGSLDDAIQITTDELASLSVTTDKLADGSITEEKIAVGAVTDSKLADGAVTLSKIEDKAVSDVKIADNAVTEDKISEGAVSLSKVNSAVIGTIQNNVISEISKIKWEKVKLSRQFMRFADVNSTLVFGRDFMSRGYLRGLFSLKSWNNSEITIGSIPKEFSPAFFVSISLMGIITGAGIEGNLVIPAALIISENGDVFISIMGKAVNGGILQFNLDPVSYWIGKKQLVR